MDELQLSPFANLPLDPQRNEFRLWRFKHSDDASEYLQLEVRVFAMNDCPQYIALSYVWGSFGSTMTIQVNDGQIQVTQNLYDFLVALHAKQRAHLIDSHKNARVLYDAADQWFWADQVCINQAELAERGHQVGLMGSIFARPRYVFAWLGTTPGEVQVSEEDSANLSLNPSRSMPSHLETFFGWIFLHHYFRRLWIVQELCLVGADQVMFWIGQHVLPLYVLSQKLSWFKVHSDRLVRTAVCADRIGGANWTRRLRKDIRFERQINLLRDILLPRSAQDGRNLDDLIHSFGQNECTDERDKIFGLLALAKASQRVDVDYAKSLEDLVRDVVKVAIKNKSRALTFMDSRMSWVMDQISKLTTILLGDDRLAQEAKAMCWAEQVPKIPQQLEVVKFDATSKSSVLVRWRPCWDQVRKTAITVKQIELAELMHKSALAYADSLGTIEEMVTRNLEELLQRHDRFGYSQEYIDWSFRKFAASTKAILQKSIIEQGFVMSDGALRHPEECFATLRRVSVAPEQAEVNIRQMSHGNTTDHSSLFLVLSEALLEATCPLRSELFEDYWTKEQKAMEEALASAEPAIWSRTGSGAQSVGEANELHDEGDEIRWKRRFQKQSSHGREDEAHGLDSSENYEKDAKKYGKINWSHTNMEWCGRQWINLWIEKFASESEAAETTEPTTLQGPELAAGPDVRPDRASSGYTASSVKFICGRQMIMTREEDPCCCVKCRWARSDQCV